MVETELSEQLGISRGTLREAMRQLQQEGLLVAQTRGRLFVRRLGPKEIGDIFAVRASLEALAASTAGRARRPDRSVVDQLRGLLADDGPGRRRARPRAADRVRPRLPPRPVPPHRQRIPAAHLGRTRRVDPHVDHVRRHTTGLSATWTSTVTTPSSTPSSPATPPPPPSPSRNTWPGRRATSSSGCDRRFVKGVRCPGACIARADGRMPSRIATDEPPVVTVSSRHRPQAAESICDSLDRTDALTGPGRAPGPHRW